MLVKTRQSVQSMNGHSMFLKLKKVWNVQVLTQKQQMFVYQESSTALLFLVLYELSSLVEFYGICPPCRMP